MDDANRADGETPSYAFGLACESYRWYRKAAIRSRNSARLVSVTLLATAATIPVSAAIAPTSSVTPAVLGAVVVVFSGLRSTFHWEENYLRFSGAREAVVAERRRYITESPPYERAETRDQALVANITRIEQQEMAGWINIAGDRSKKKPPGGQASMSST